MSDILAQLEAGIQELFPEAEDMTLTLETTLQEIPDWDSMSSVNLQGFIEQTFQVAIPQEVLAEDLTIGELIRMIQNPETIDQPA